MNNKIYEKIQAECDRQDEKWGIRNNHPLEWLAILFEEVGEVAMEVNDAGHAVEKLDLDKYETELVQCGAVITQMLKNIDNYKDYQESL
jgi:NTP pyrophosphatase (non-canonical NTP hydrolase)